MRSLPFVEALGRAARERRLVLLLWVLQLVPALLATVPLATFLAAALGPAPVADRSFERLDLALLADFVEPNRALFRALGPVFGVFAAVALLANAFFAGGALEVLLRPDPRPLALRFTRGGGRYFARFLRMGLAAVPLAAIVGGLVSTPFWIARAALSFRAEGAKFWLGLAGMAAAALGFVAVLLALDLARIAVAHDDARGGVRALFRTARTLLRRPAAPFALWLGLGTTLVIAVVLLGALRNAVGVGSGGAILASFLLLQIAIAARAFYRVALWSGEIALAPLAGGGSRIRD